MKIAHLILAHKSPEQLEKLIKSLTHPNFTLFIHLDKKSNISKFIHLADYENVIFIKKRTKVYWAGYGTIAATLNGFREIFPLGFDYINVISAQDYPLKPANAIYNYITERKGTEFISCESIENEWKEAAPRVYKYHLINWQIPGKYQLEKWVNKMLPPRKFPLNYKIVGRANWFTLTTDAVKYIINFLDQNPKIVRYFKYCWGADEFIFATALYNSSFKENIKPNLVYVDWTGQKGGHPRILTSDDYNNIVLSDKLFARKFDIEIDAVIIDKLDNWNKEQLKKDI